MSIKSFKTTGISGTSLQSLGAEYKKPQVSGGTLYNDGTYYYRKFTSSSTFTVQDSPLNVEILLVGGGGGTGGRYSGYSAGCGGAGGGGGVINKSLTIPAGSHSVIIGAGGAPGSVNLSPNTRGSNGGNTTFYTELALGGGGGAAGDKTASTPTRGASGGDGASGGGAGNFQTTTNNTTYQSGYPGRPIMPGQGNDGGLSFGGSYGTNPDNQCGGGGGAGSAASFPNGGDGRQFLDFANATSSGKDGGYFAGGGRGYRRYTYGANGLGGGNTANCGGGASGVFQNNGGQSGGSGIAIIRYLMSDVE